MPGYLSMGPRQWSLRLVKKYIMCARIDQYLPIISARGVDDEHRLVVYPLSDGEGSA
jgi:hypothetical protein